MTVQSGANTVFILGIESTFGSAPTDGFNLPFNTSNLKGMRSLTAPKTIRGNTNVAKPVRGRKDVSGSVVVPVDSIAMWYWLQVMFGSPTTTGSGPYTHEFKRGSSQPSFTVEHQFTDLATDIYEQFYGLTITSWSQNLGIDGEAVATFNITGSDNLKDTSAFDASPTSVSLGRLNHEDLSVTEGGGSLSNGTEASFTVNFNPDLNKYYMGGGGIRGAIPAGIMSVSGNLKTVYEDISLYTKALNETESSLIFTFNDSSTSQMIIEFNEIMYEENSPAVDGPEGLMVDLNFQAYYDNHADASAITVSVVNSEAHA